MKGKLRAEGAALLARTISQTALMQGSRAFVLDFTDLQQIDGPAITELLHLQAAMQHCGSRLLLTHVPDLVEHILAVHQRENDFDRFPNLFAALQCLAPAAA